MEALVTLKRKSGMLSAFCKVNVLASTDRSADIVGLTVWTPGDPLLDQKITVALIPIHLLPGNKLNTDPHDRIN